MPSSRMDEKMLKKFKEFKQFKQFNHFQTIHIMKQLKTLNFKKYKNKKIALWKLKIVGKIEKNENKIKNLKITEFKK